MNFPTMYVVVMVAMVTVSVCVGLPETTDSPIVPLGQAELMACLWECDNLHHLCLDKCEKLLHSHSDKPSIARECNCMRRLRRCTKTCHQFYPKPE